MRLVILSIFFVVFIWQNTAGQVSQGGKPLEISVLKSRGIPEITMPVVLNHELRQQNDQRRQQEIRLKPFQFAHGFDVEISPENSGLWVRNVDGYDVWKLKIRSVGAYSLNLIFNDFFLPEGARLFLFNENEGHYQGAFTSLNNKKSGKFAVSPVAGDELTIQYEVPAWRGQPKGFVITQVNHDFTGILKFSERRPMGISAGACNIDINCEISDNWAEQADAVCRIIVHGREICSGVLVNNSAENERPYILSAAHCYDRPEYAETSVFTFNYESPYCAPLDGDPSNSVSGAEMRAFSDSLDFSLVEMSLIPPPDYRPFYAGWDRSGSFPDSSASIHHPQGDIKKIAIDRNSPVFASFPQSGYTANGFLKVLRWEEGVTENGSSGGPLFNPSGNIIGTLTGGSATCQNPVSDYFSRFDRAWTYRADSSRQLKYWLDPLNKDISALAGKRVYTGVDFCMAFTNLEDDDEHENVVLYDGTLEVGHWGGTNGRNITEFTEQFSVAGDEQLSGVSLGVGLLRLASPFSNSEITIKVYNGKLFPEDLIYSKKVFLRNMVSNAMNLVLFDQIIEPSDTFFVGYELSNLQSQEQFVLYQSLREAEKPNYFWFKQNNQWYNFKQANSDGYSMTNVISLVACNVNEQAPDRPLVTRPMESIVYPNPVRDLFTFEIGQELIPENVRVYNLLGQEVDVSFSQFYEKKIQISLSGNLPGIYFVRYNSRFGNISEKVIYAP